MAEKILDTNIPREEGHLYFVKGNPLSLYKAKMARGGRKKQEKK